MAVVHADGRHCVWAWSTVLSLAAAMRVPPGRGLGVGFSAGARFR